eukprot:Skav217036  [mRNA]  locus=scaffold1803:410211:413697:- [translate_table: standard]
MPSSKTRQSIPSQNEKLSKESPPEVTSFQIKYLEDEIEDDEEMPEPPPPPAHPPPAPPQRQERSWAAGCHRGFSLGGLSGKTLAIQTVEWSFFLFELLEESSVPRPVIRLENALEVHSAQEPWRQVPLSVGRSQGTGRAVGVIGDQRGRGQAAYMLPTAYSSGRDAGRPHMGPHMDAISPPSLQATGTYMDWPQRPMPGSCNQGFHNPVGLKQSQENGEMPGPAPAGPLGNGRTTGTSEVPQSLKPHGTQELPSVGSAGHAFGTCRPCAFFYAKGCQNGYACSFCHLCDRGEKKRRQKQKKASFRGGA